MGGAGRGRAEPLAEVIRCWMEQERERGLNLAALYDHLVAEHGYEGSYESIQRRVRAHYPRPRQRARRRVETPPGLRRRCRVPGGTSTRSTWSCRTPGTGRWSGRRARTSWPGWVCTTGRCAGWRGCRRCCGRHASSSPPLAICCSPAPEPCTVAYRPCGCRLFGPRGIPSNSQALGFRQLRSPRRASSPYAGANIRYVARYEAA